MTAVPIEREDGHLDRVVEAVEREHERITITRDGEPVAVVMDPRELAGLEDTIDLLRSPLDAERLDKGTNEIAIGDAISSAEVLARFGRRD